MPQLDFANPYTLAQVFWMAVIFIALYFALSRLALPHVANVIEARGARIAADLEVAREAKTRADQAVSELTKATKSAHAEAQAAITNAIAQARSEALAESRASNEALDARLAEAETRIEAARSAALSALSGIAAETAAAIVERLTGTQASPASIQGAVGRQLAKA